MFVRRRNSGRVSSPAKSRTRAKRLRLESLEDRRMLALDFVFNLTTTMPDEMVLGFNQAANIWKSVLTDDVTVRVDISAANLGATTLGSTGANFVSFQYAEVRNALNADALSPADQIAVANLSSASSLGVFINRTSDNPLGANSPLPYLDIDGGLNNRSMLLNRANARALGLIAADDPGVDGNIQFSTAFPFDYDPSDGITPGMIDFVAVAAHEIGHLLGFVSGADVLDVVASMAISAPDDAYSVLSVLDLFRSSVDSRLAGADLDMSVDIRVKDFSLDGGASILGTFSTGRNLGDGEQASHWMDDLGILSANLGLLDPTLGSGQLGVVTPLDVTAFDVIGWDTAERPIKFTVTPSGGSTVVKETGPAQIANELASTDKATVVLNQQPTSNVVIEARSSDVTESIVGPTQLIFTPSNWNIPQTVTITGVNDGVPDGNQESLIVFSVNRQLSDSAFDDAMNVFLPVTTLDGGLITLAHTGPNTVVYESGALTQDTIFLALGEPPQTPVRLSIQSLDPSEAVVTISEVTFTSTNWNLPKSVIVRSVDDQDIDGDQNVTIRVSVIDATSDPLFRDVPDAEISVKVVDNEARRGDANGDRAVTSLDLGMLKTSFGTTSKPSDLNGDGRVDAADYTVWRDNLGAGVPDALPANAFGPITVYAHDAGFGGCCCPGCVGAAAATATDPPLTASFDPLTIGSLSLTDDDPSPDKLIAAPRAAVGPDRSWLYDLAATSNSGDAADEAFAEFSDASEEEDSVDALFAEDELDAALVLL